MGLNLFQLRAPVASTSILPIQADLNEWPLDFPSIFRYSAALGIWHLAK